MNRLLVSSLLLTVSVACEAPSSSTSTPPPARERPPPTDRDTTDAVIDAYVNAKLCDPLRPLIVRSRMKVDWNKIIPMVLEKVDADLGPRLARQPKARRYDLKLTCPSVRQLSERRERDIFRSRGRGEKVDRRDLRGYAAFGGSRAPRYSPRLRLKRELGETVDAISFSPVAVDDSGTRAMVLSTTDRAMVAILLAKGPQGWRVESEQRLKRFNGVPLVRAFPDAGAGDHDAGTPDAGAPTVADAGHASETSATSADAGAPKAPPAPRKFLRRVWMCGDTAIDLEGARQKPGKHTDEWFGTVAETVVLPAFPFDWVLEKGNRVKTDSGFVEYSPTLYLLSLPAPVDVDLNGVRFQIDPNGPYRFYTENGQECGTDTFKALKPFTVPVAGGKIRALAGAVAFNSDKGRGGLDRPDLRLHLLRVPAGTYRMAGNPFRATKTTNAIVARRAGNGRRVPYDVVSLGEVKSDVRVIGKVGGRRYTFQHFAVDNDYKSFQGFLAEPEPVVVGKQELKAPFIQWDQKTKKVRALYFSSPKTIMLDGRERTQQDLAGPLYILPDGTPTEMQLTAEEAWDKLNGIKKRR